MKIMNFLAAVALVALSLNFSSCKKDDVSEGVISGDNVTTFQDDAEVNDIMDDIDNESDDVANGLKSASADTTLLSGRTIVWTTNNDGTRTAVVTYINFQNPKAKNARIKNGVIRIVVTGKRSDNTYKRVVTFENFTINGNTVEGTKTIEKISDLVYKVTMTGGKVTFDDETFVTCESVRTRTMVEGASTPLYIWDDAYTIEGSASGLTRKGLAYTKIITIPIKFFTTYRFPVSGSYTLTVGENVLTLDYGNGTMDVYATVTKNGVTKTISLRR